MKYRFGSRDWLAAAHGIIVQRASALAAMGIGDRISFCDTYRNCPLELGWPDGTLSWSCVYQNGVVDLRIEERDDVQFKVSGNHAALAPAMIFEVGHDKERRRQFKQMVAASIAAGDIFIEIGTEFSEPGNLEPFHDVLARVTCIS